jgi:glucose/arabinose dehydrogenase
MAVLTPSDHGELDDELPAAGPRVHPFRFLRRHWRETLVITLVLVGLFAWWAQGRGIKYRVMKAVFGEQKRPVPVLNIAIADTVPVDCDGNVPLDTTIRISLEDRGGPIDPATFRPEMVSIVRSRDQQVLPAASSIDADGITLVLDPNDPLEPDHCYSVYVTTGLKTVKGIKVKNFSMAFTTEGSLDKSIRFEKVKLPVAQDVGFTAVQMAPDGRLWAGTEDGRIFRFAVSADNTLSEPQVITSLQEHSGGPRLISGFCFDPQAPATAPVIYVNHGVAAFKDVPDFTGKMTRMSGPNLEKVEDILVGVPRSFGDHLNLQPVFGPDGAIYYSQGSNSAFGAPDETWGWRPERLLTAVIARVDLAKLPPGQPLDVTTADGGGTYDPRAPGAAVTVYAKGVRLAYDLVWHSDGRLYVPVNGSSSGGNSPAGKGAPALTKIPLSEHDWLLRIEPGKYYGHPNPTWDHYVLNGGNPTAGGDWAEVAQYPVGTLPDPEYVPPIHDFGKHVSANGVLEYKSPVFGGKLQGMLVVCRYNVGSDLIFIGLDEKGDVNRYMVGMEGTGDLSSPLDVTEDVRTGAMYVAEYGARCITLIRPVKADRTIANTRE